MANIESNSVKSVELPIYHWSQIASPRYKDLNQSLLLEPVTVTQTIHLHNQTPKTHSAHPALVIYDSRFVQYKLLEVVVPFLSHRLDSAVILGLTDVDSILDSDFLQNLATLLIDSIADAIKLHAKTSRECEEIGITLDNDSSTVLRTVKMSLAREYKLSQTTVPTV